MNRRAFLASTAATGSVIAVSGCLGRLRGGGDDTGMAEGVSRDESNSPGYGGAYRIYFDDQTGTLGQVAQPQPDDDYNIVNQYSEDDWKEMDDNDLQVARKEIEDSGRGGIDALRPYVKDELEQSPADEADVRALPRGIGIGMNEETGISDSFSTANVMKPAIGEFAREYLDSDVQAWITGTTLPVTEGRFVHLIVTIAYSDEAGNLKEDYVEPSAPDTTSDAIKTAVRSPENSVYSQTNDEDMEYVTGHEYRKALEMAQSGQIEKEGRAHPVRAISTNLLSNMWSMVDSGKNDISWENPPPNGLITHVSQEFGRSVEDAFYDLTEQRLGYMENIGRGMQLFYEKFDGRSNLAVGGTLDTPEFYLFPDSEKETAWNFEYDDISELVA